MNEPPSIDDILDSIRARVTGEVAPPAEAAPAPPPPLPAPVMADSGVTLEALMRSLLEPMLKAWLDAHLPELCERIAQEEIRRLTGQV